MARALLDFLPSLFGAPLIFTPSFLSLRLIWNPRVDTGVTVSCDGKRNPPVVIYSACIPLSLHIPHIFPRHGITAKPVSIVFADSLVSRRALREGFARERTFVAKKREKGGIAGRTYSPTLARFVFPSCHSPTRGGFLDFPPVSLLPAQRFPAADTTGLLILIIDRGIIKVAPARGRFQLRISVSLGTIGRVDGAGQGSEAPGQRRNRGRAVTECSFAGVLPHHCLRPARPLPLPPAGRQNAGRTTREDFSN